MIKRILIMLLLTGSVYADSLFIGPSFYYTNGTYSDNNSSRSFAFYNVMQLSSRYTLLQHYDNLTISNTGWKFKQQGIAGGIIANYQPYYFKVNYGHYMGDYLDNATTPEYSYNYSDFINVYNTDFFHYADFNYIGASYSYVDASGLLQQDNHQLTLRFDKYAAPELFISIKPTATVITNGRTLFAAAIKAIYYPSDKFIIKGGGFAGERVYYFDSDLIIMYNQDDIQKYLAFAQLEYIITPNLALITAYNHTAFSKFEINYFVAGIRSGFWF